MNITPSNLIAASEGGHVHMNARVLVCLCSAREGQLFFLWSHMGTQKWAKLNYFQLSFNILCFADKNVS